MASPESELKFFNAVSLHLQGSYKAIQKLKDECRTWKAAFETIASSSSFDPDKEWERLQTSGVQLLLAEDSDFPALLREIPWPPFGLYVRGTPLNSVQGKRVAMVGTRKPTPAGMNAAQKFARTFVRANISVVSGLAVGIDAISHQTVLDERGIAIGVLACGLDRFYPQQNIRLGKQILDRGGTIISEYPLGTPTLPYRFIERNRLVSGLCCGIVIIEAPKRSGTISTARFALEQNREVFVIPGAISNPNYEGSHSLIKSGASLVTGPEEVLETLGIEKGKLQFPAGGPRSPVATKLAQNDELVLNVIKDAAFPLAVDQICELTKLPVTTVSQSLTNLILEEYLKEEVGRYFCV